MAQKSSMPHWLPCQWSSHSSVVLNFCLIWEVACCYVSNFGSQSKKYYDLIRLRLADKRTPLMMLSTPLIMLFTPQSSLYYKVQPLWNIYLTIGENTPETIVFPQQWVTCISSAKWLYFLRTWVSRISSAQAIRLYFLSIMIVFSQHWVSCGDPWLWLQVLCGVSHASTQAKGRKLHSWCQTFANCGLKEDIRNRSIIFVDQFEIDFSGDTKRERDILLPSTRGPPAGAGQVGKINITQVSKWPHVESHIKGRRLSTRAQSQGWKKESRRLFPLRVAPSPVSTRR